MLFATGNLPFDILLLVVGIFLLIKGSGWFVDSASFIAKRFDISDAVIGLTLVSIGTSLPELATNVYASFSGEADVALGNAVGSNITNITLVLGIGALLHGTLPISDDIAKLDIRAMMLVYILFGAMCVPWLGGEAILSRWDGMLLLAGCALYSWWLLRRNRIPSESDDDEEAEQETLQSMWIAVVLFLVGLVMIFSGAKMSVDTVVITANKLGTPKELVSATIIAFGTSVPELAVTVTGLRKGKQDLALGNIVGSCVFNILLVMGVAMTITPVHVSSDMSSRMLPIMLVSGAGLLLFVRGNRRLDRWQSGLLFVLYVVFVLDNIRLVL